MRVSVSADRSIIRRSLLLLMFAVLMIDTIPGFGIGIGPGLSGKNLFLYFLIIMICIRSTTSPTGIRLANLNVHIPYLILILYAITTWALASAFDPTYNTIRGMMTLKNQLLDYYLFWFAFCYGVEKKADFLWLIRAVVVIMMLISALTLIDFLNIPDLGIVGTYKGRLEGPFGSANQYGALQAFLLPLSIALTPTGQSVFRRWLWRVGILIIGVLLIATGSRGAYLATVVGAIIGVIYLRRYLDMKVVMRTAVISVLGGSVLLMLFAIFNYEFLVERFAKTASGNIYSASSGRIEIWTAAFLVMMEWPTSFLVGYGWNAYDTSGIWKAAHNEYIDKLFELGIIGLSLFLVVLCAIPFSIRRILENSSASERRIFIGFIFSMLIILVDVFFVALPDTWDVIWVVVGLISGLSSFYGRNRQIDEKLSQQGKEHSGA